MKTLFLDRLKELLEYNPASGEIRWKVRKRPDLPAGSIAGTLRTTKDGQTYRQIIVDGKHYQAHRLAWLLSYGVMPSKQIDHIDGDGANNKLDNLREVSNTENQRNAKRRSDNSTGTTGVYFCEARNYWQAYISVDRKRRHLGYFRTKEDAVGARKAAELMYGFHENHGKDRKQ